MFEIEREAIHWHDLEKNNKNLQPSEELQEIRDLQHNNKVLG